MAHFYRHHTPSYTTLSTPVSVSHDAYYRHHHTRRPRTPPISSTTTSRHYTRITPRYFDPVSVDPILAHHSRAAHVPIEFDLTLPPSQILRSHGPSRSSYASLSQRELAAPATSPAVPHMHIQCEDLPWAIEVYPASHGSGYVTVGDVLNGIYRGLRHRVSSAEWDACAEGMRQRVRDAWFRRCKRQQSHRERAYESNNGLRRIDWLAKSHVFQGLSPGRSHSQWVMHVGQGEKSVKFWASS